MENSARRTWDSIDRAVVEVLVEVVAGRGVQAVGELRRVHAPDQSLVEVPGVAQQQVVARAVVRRGEPLELARREVELRAPERGHAARGPVERGRGRRDRGAGDARAHATRSREVAVDVVAREQLVAAEAGKHDGDVLTDEAVQQVQLERVDLRLLGVADRLGEVREDRLGQHQLVVVGLVGSATNRASSSSSLGSLKPRLNVLIGPE